MIFLFSEYFEQHYMSVCSNCSEEEKTNLKNLCLTFYKRYEEDYNKLVEKYDPNNENREEFLAWITDDKGNM